MTKKEYLGLFIEDLDIMMEKLRGYCHYKKCKRDIDDCPQDCCSKKLGLDTAMAWKCADGIDDLIYDMRNFSNKSYGQHRKELQKYIDIFYDNADILGFHATKYEKLFSILYE